MESNTSNKDVQQIKKENLRLKAELQLLKGKKKAGTTLGKLASKITTTIFLGNGLKRSVLRLFEEIPNGKVSKVTLADVSSHLVWRLTRVGIFTLLLALIPLCILGIQTYILNTQNQLLQYQNERLDQQINLEEGNRRSSLIFLMSNIMDKMGEELKASNTKNRLSDALIGRIVSLSQALRPYRYLENDQLITQPLSPERGQLLISLTNSALHETTYEKIFEKADFSFADLKHANFNGNYMQGIQLQYANLEGASFKHTDLEYANLEGANLQYTEFEETYMNSIKLGGANLRNSHLHNVKMTYANISADFTNAEISGDFRNSFIDSIDLDGIKLGFLDLEGLEIRNPEMIALVDKDTLDVANIFEVPDANRDYLNENFFWKQQAVQKEDMTKGYLYVLTRKKASTLSTMDNCLKKVIELIKSADEIQQLERDMIKKKESLTFTVEANPFGEENLGVRLDSIYLYRISTEDADPLFTISWIEFNPFKHTLKKFALDDTTTLTFNKSLLKSFPLECEH